MAFAAVSVGCGSASYGRDSEPRPIITAPARPTVTPTQKPPEGNSTPSLAAQGPGNEPAFTPVPQSPGPEPTLAPPPRAVVSATSLPNKITEGSTLGGVEQWRGLVESIFPAFAVETVLAIMWCESRGNPNAVSPTDDHGLMQINRQNHWRFGGRSPYDPVANLEVAYAMSGGGASFAAWTCN